MTQGKQMTQQRLGQVEELQLYAQYDQRKQSQIKPTEQLQKIGSIRLNSSSSNSRDKQQQIQILQQILSKVQEQELVQQQQLVKLNSQTEINRLPKQIDQSVIASSVQERNGVITELREELDIQRKRQQEVKEKHAKAQYIFKELQSVRQKQDKIEQMRLQTDEMGARHQSGMRLQLEVDQRLQHQEQKTQKLTHLLQIVDTKIQDLNALKTRALQYGNQNTQLNLQLSQKQAEVQALQKQIQEASEILSLEVPQETDNFISDQIQRRIEVKQSLRRVNSELLRKIEMFFREIE
ncbi:Hypothetical_protein [Hexamita inflata]|uniref:Hypothetical_protein n=1 Tax=Hexamita inflata TaxID=28002 RepID=A0AA86UZD6_9EUKA|nr:Hypothetical protein HINF_LOCUS61979 [Hexamita inflata]